MTELPGATYVYCIVDSGGRVNGARAPAGVPGATRPRALPLAGTWWMVAADVPCASYGEDALRGNLRNLDWVSAVAVAHEAVIEHFTRVRGATVIPMKLLTLFSSEEKAREALRKRRKEIAAAIRRIAGCEEWGVRVFAGSAIAPDAVPPGSGAGSGTAFLAAKKAAREAGHAARARARDAADKAYDALARASRDARQRPRTAEPGANPPLLDAAFLVKAASRVRFKGTAKRQAEACALAGAQMTLSGPWPAYNFVGDTGETT